MRGDGNRELLPTPGVSEADEDGGGRHLLRQAVLQGGEPPLRQAGGDDVDLGPGLLSPLDRNPELRGLVDTGVWLVDKQGLTGLNVEGEIFPSSRHC